MKPYLSLFVVVMFVGIAFAQTAVPEKVESKPVLPAKTAVGTRNVTGKIISIDPVNETICVQYVRKGTCIETIRINAETKIKSGLKKVELSDLKIGAKVTVSKESVDGKTVAKKVTVQTARVGGGGGANGGGGAAIGFGR